MKRRRSEPRFISLCERYEIACMPSRENGMVNVLGVISDGECNTDVAVTNAFFEESELWQLDALKDALGLIQRLYDELMGDTSAFGELAEVCECGATLDPVLEFIANGKAVCSDCMTKNLSPAAPSNGKMH